ncbi:MAG: hypothetical protein ACI841_004819 [Planctomycetota bacterium]|jgi:hypothetical protein
MEYEIVIGKKLRAQRQVVEGQERAGRHVGPTRIHRRGHCHQAATPRRSLALRHPKDSGRFRTTTWPGAKSRSNRGALARSWDPLADSLRHADLLSIVGHQLAPKRRRCVVAVQDERSSSTFKHSAVVQVLPDSEGHQSR